jgi:DNA-binding transcriptional regulator WhiA
MALLMVPFLSQTLKFHEFISQATSEGSRLARVSISHPEKVSYHLWIQSFINEYDEYDLIRSCEILCKS